MKTSYIKMLYAVVVALLILQECSQIYAHSEGNNNKDNEPTLIDEHIYGEWHVKGDQHYRICLDDYRFREEHTANWVKEIGNKPDGKEYCYCTVCGMELEVECVDEDFPQFYLSRGGEKVTLTCNTSVDFLFYQWFSCDKDKKNPKKINRSNQKEYTTDAFSDKGIYFYYCTCSNDGVNFQETNLFVIAYTGLPVVSIETEGRKTIDSKYDYIEAQFRISGGEYRNGFVTNVNIKGHGNSSWAAPKKSYALSFPSKINLLGKGVGKKYALIGNYFDKTLLRNWYASYLSNEIWKENEWHPDYIPVDVIINDEYVGSYSLVDTIRIDKTRIAVRDIEDMYDSHLPLSSGGFIIEVDDRGDDGGNSFLTDNKVAIVLKRPDLEDVPQEKKEEIFEYVRNYIQSVETLLYKDDYIENDVIHKFFDVRSVVDWYLISELMKNSDAKFYSSVYFYFNPDDSLIHMGPIWDSDLSCGNYDIQEIYSPEGLWIADAKWIDRFFGDERFVKEIQNRWHEVESYIGDKSISGLKKLADYIEISADLNFIRWPLLGENIWPNPPGFQKRNTYISEVEYLMCWINKRIDYLNSEIEGW